jgi:hypothetical protein
MKKSRGKDSNLRRLAPAGLQPAPFGRSGTPGKTFLTDFSIFNLLFSNLEALDNKKIDFYSSDSFHNGIPAIPLLFC